MSKDYDIIVSLSGGKTSAYLLWLLIQDGLKVLAVFMNTGLEHEKTYKFLKNLKRAWKFDLICLEPRVFFEINIGTGYKIVKFEKMHKGTEIAKAVVEKYGLFGMGYLHCTREMKLQPFRTWKKEHYPDLLTAIGIRDDETDRQSPLADKEKLTYPLIKKEIRKHHVENFFEKNSFTLEIPEHLGNCVGCWKKSNNKLIRAVRDERDHFVQLRNLEMIDKKRDMYRGKRRVADLLIDAELKLLEESDTGSGCEESCEVFSGETVDLFDYIEKEQIKETLF